MASQGKSNGFIERIRIVQTSIIFFVLCSLIVAGASMILLDVNIAHYRSDAGLAAVPASAIVAAGKGAI